jgi:maleate cis-trans isomerase
MQKFGCISPSIISFPWDLNALVPETVQAAVVTLNVRNGLPGEYERALGNMHGATDVLIDEGAKAIVVFGVPVSARRGFGAERVALDALTADRGAVPILSSLGASALAFRHLGVTRPLLITQYADDVNAAIVAFYRDAGLEAAGASGLGATNAAAVNALSPSDFRALAVSALGRHPAADGIFLSARGNLLDVTRQLEAEIGLPVIEQLQPAVWWALSQLDGAALAAAGSLLSNAPTGSANHAVRAR